MTDSYVYVITALLPLAASMVVFQANPYHALVLRGILGATAALVYAVLGAADVALTEALMGTMLAITLYAVAVRSSLVLRLGVLKEAIASATDTADVPEPHQARQRPFEQLLAELRAVFGKRHMRVELVPYRDERALQQALMAKEVHATCISAAPAAQNSAAIGEPPCYTATRIRRLYEIMQTELSSTSTTLDYLIATKEEQP